MMSRTIEAIPEYIDNIPNIAGSEELIESTIKAAAGRSPYAGDASIHFDDVRAAFAIALHQQPLIPARGKYYPNPADQ